MPSATPTPITGDDLAGIPHGFFGRRGGVSTGVYDSLNCGLGSHDEPAAVRKNRARVAAMFGTGPERLLTGHQVHSAEAVIVEGPWGPAGQPKADALVTKTPGVVVGALAADCMPILFADAAAGVVAAAHAGWRGALAGIEGSTIAAMERLGARRDRIRAVIGPCISGAAYEVGDDFMATFLRADPAAERWFTRSPAGARPHLDLPGYMLGRLTTAGIASARWIGACTYAAPDAFYSYRRTTHARESNYGRQITVITPPTVSRIGA